MREGGKHAIVSESYTNWCKAVKIRDYNLPDAISENERTLLAFDFVFYLAMRHIDKKHTSVIDMICNDYLFAQFENIENVKTVLNDTQFCCLILLDGLDEWPGRCSPITSSVKNSTLFQTMRPWKLEQLSPKYSSSDKIVEILGLDNAGVQEVVRRVLVHYSDIPEGSDEYEEKHSLIAGQLCRMDEIFRIPLLATYFAVLWDEEEDISDSVTAIYISIMDFLFEKAYTENRLSDETLEQVTEMHTLSRCPEILQGHACLYKYKHALMKLGKLAFEDLTAKETMLVFRRPEVSEKIGRHILEFALQTGILCKSSTPGNINCVSLNFFHKTVQEFLAAFFVINDNDNKLGLLLKSYQTFDQVMRISNVLLFVCGLMPRIGLEILGQLSEFSHNYICSEGLYFEAHTHEHIKSIFQFQCECINEIEEHAAKEDMINLEEVGASNVYIDNLSKATFQTKAKQFLLNCPSIAYLYLSGVPLIDTSTLEDFLDRSKHLMALRVIGRTLPSIKIRSSSLTVLSLHLVTLTQNSVDDLETVLRGSASLRMLTLWKLKSGNKPVTVCVEANIEILTLEAMFLSLKSVNFLKYNLHKNKNLARLRLFDLQLESPSHKVCTCTNTSRCIHEPRIELILTSMQHLRSIDVNHTPVSRVAIVDCHSLKEIIVKDKFDSNRVTIDLNSSLHSISRIILHGVDGILLEGLLNEVTKTRRVVHITFECIQNIQKLKSLLLDRRYFSIMESDMVGEFAKFVDFYALPV